MQRRKVPCIIPTLPVDYKEVCDYLYRILDMLPVNRLIFIGNDELKELVFEDASRLGKEDRIELIDENTILDFGEVHESYARRVLEINQRLGREVKTSSTGWYYQQFLKMEYSKYCEDEYYLCWDADTIPLRPTDMFNDTGVPFLDIKPEYNPTYFETLKNLLNMDKAIEQSFISEHMLFKKSIMQELIEEIMKRNLPGDTFYEKIFSAINNPHIGFSEFETYGTYVAYKYPNEYRLRHWKSMRNTGCLVNRTEMTEDDLKWLATGFDAATFERYHYAFDVLSDLFKNRRYREKLRADIFYEELLKEGLFGDYRFGGLVCGDLLAPI